MAVVLQELPHTPDRFGNPRPGKSFPGITEKFTTLHRSECLGLPDTPTCRAEIPNIINLYPIDQGLGALIQHKDAKLWKDVLFLLPTTASQCLAPKLPCMKACVRLVSFAIPMKKIGVKSGALVSWLILCPLPRLCWWSWSDGKATHDLLKILSSGYLRRSKISSNARNFSWALLPSHTRSDQPQRLGRGVCLYTFHEITMYYPMRVVRERKYKLIWNIAHELPYPSLLIFGAPTWQAQYKLGMSAPYGMKTVGGYIHRDEFELYDLEADPHEGKPRWVF